MKNFLSGIDNNRLLGEFFPKNIRQSRPQSSFNEIALRSERKKFFGNNNMKRGFGSRPFWNRERRHSLKSNGEFFPPFRPSFGKNSLPGRGARSYQKSVGFLSFSFFRVVCFRHGKLTIFLKGRLSSFFHENNRSFTHIINTLLTQSNVFDKLGSLLKEI